MVTWQEIEHDIEVLETTGAWPNGILPEWAKASARSSVVDHGLREIIRQLKVQLLDKDQNN